jgi:hypothetical protein
MHERFDFSPEVGHQRCRFAVSVGPNGAQPVFVIMLGPPFVAHLMGVVESHQSGAIGSVQRQRIVKPCGFCAVTGTWLTVKRTQ